MTGVPRASRSAAQPTHDATGGPGRETSMTRIYVGVILVQVLTTLALLWLEFAYTR